MNHYVALWMDLADTSQIQIQLLLGVAFFSAILFLVLLAAIVRSSRKNWGG